MTITTLFSDGVDRYIEENRDRPGDLWLFLHVPKTAGSALRKQLFNRMKPSVGIDIGQMDQARPTEERREEAAQKFLVKDRQRPFRCAGGHFTAKQLQLIMRDRPQTKPITFLRNPVDRVISEYFYQCTPAHPPHEKFKKQFPALQTYVSDPSSQNNIFKYLAPSRPIDNRSLIDFLESTFVFVGLQDEYAPSLRLLGRLVSQPLDARERIRSRDQTGAGEPAVNEELRAAIEEANKRDMVIFNHFRRRLWPILRAVKGAA